jgi:hypothetical protein
MCIHYFSSLPLKANDASEAIFDFDDRRSSFVAKMHGIHPHCKER